MNEHRKHLHFTAELLSSANPNLENFLNTLLTQSSGVTVTFEQNKHIIYLLCYYLCCTVVHHAIKHFSPFSLLSFLLHVNPKDYKQTQSADFQFLVWSSFPFSWNVKKMYKCSFPTFPTFSHMYFQQLNCFFRKKCWASFRFAPKKKTGWSIWVHWG